MELFYFFLFLIAVVRISYIMVNKCGKSRYPFLMIDFKGNAFSFPSLKMMTAVSLSYKTFLMLRYVPSILTLFRVFFFHK